MAGSANNRASLAGAPHSRGSVARAPLAHRTLAAGIADRLRQEILDGVHAEGTPLRQDELASAFKVSRIPVREALIQLEGEGLVEILTVKPRFSSIGTRCDNCSGAPSEKTLRLALPPCAPYQPAPARRPPSAASICPNRTAPPAPAPRPAAPAATAP